MVVGLPKIRARMDHMDGPQLFATSPRHAGTCEKQGTSESPTIGSHRQEMGPFPFSTLRTNERKGNGNGREAIRHLDGHVVIAPSQHNLTYFLD